MRERIEFLACCAVIAGGMALAGWVAMVGVVVVFGP